MASCDGTTLIIASGEELGCGGSSRNCVKWRYWAFAALLASVPLYGVQKALKWLCGALVSGVSGLK